MDWVEFSKLLLSMISKDRQAAINSQSSSSDKPVHPSAIRHGTTLAAEERIDTLSVWSQSSRGKAGSSTKRTCTVVANQQSGEAKKIRS